MKREARHAWRNRIVGYGEEAPDQLLANPRNWRVHPKFQQEALAGVLRDVGWVQDVIVNRRTGFVVDGHLRVALALRTGQPTVPVKYVDLSEEEEATVLATLDPLTALATADRERLDALLREVRTGEAAVQQLVADLAEQAGVVPPAESTPTVRYHHRFELVVECADEAQLEALFTRLTEEGYRCRVLML